MNPQRKIRVAFVGLGMAVTPHAQSVLDLAGRVEVVHAHSPSRERRAAFANRFSFSTCERLELILEDASVDAVAVLTPPNTHAAIVLRCAAAGKHVLLEKPLEISTERALALVEACERAGVILGVVLQHRHRPAVEQLAALLARGELGNLVGASAEMRLWRPQSYYDQPGRGTLARDGGGVLLTQGIHTLDVLLSLVGDARDVFAFATTSALHRMESEDLVCASVRWQSGALGSIEATTAAHPGRDERIELIGTLGSASLAGSALEVSWLDGRQLTRPRDATTGGTGADPMAFSHEHHRSVWVAFLDAIEQGVAPRVTGREALRVHRFIDALLASATSGERVRLG
jgi:predicted dehydrogenase